MSDVTFPILGYDIGGTKIAVCVADSKGKILAKKRLPSGAVRNYAESLPDMIAAGHEVVAQAGIDFADVKACGICAPGPLDVPGGRMLKSPNMPWDGVPIRDDLAAALGIPVFFENDANGGALAEGYFGAAKDCQDFVYLTMSTGIGGGVVSHGRLLQGSTGNGAELGHMVLDIDGPPCGCGMKGCFEAYCSGRNVALRLRRLMTEKPCEAIMQLPEVQGDLEKLDYLALRAGVTAGIPEALEFWDELCLRMAQGIGIQMMAFNPSKIILGTIFLYSGEMLMEPVRRYLPRFVWNDMSDVCTLEVSSLGSKIGELAGIATALYGLKQG
jgi:glucokinase